MFLIYRPLDRLTPGVRLKVQPDERRHIRARRIGQGQTVHVGDGKGRRYAAVLSGEEMTLSDGPPKEQSETGPIIATAIPQGNRWDWLLQKATELGVMRILPINWSRSERKDFNFDRSVRIIAEAAAQSQRFVLPELETKPLTLDVALSGIESSQVVLCDAEGDSQTPTNDDAVYFIGPEGGLTESEKRLFVEWQALTIQFAPHVLRVETAAIAACVHAQKIL